MSARSRHRVPASLVDPSKEALCARFRPQSS